MLFLYSNLMKILYSIIVVQCLSSKSFSKLIEISMYNHVFDFINTKRLLYKYQFWTSRFNLYYCFAYPYLIYCNHVWGSNYPTNSERLIIIQNKLIRIISCSPYRAHTEPLFYANKMINIKDINFCVVQNFCIHVQLCVESVTRYIYRLLCPKQ